MKAALCLLAFGVVVAELPSDSGSKPDSASDASGESAWTTSSWNSGSSGTGYYNDAGFSGGSSWGNRGSVGGSGSGWDWGGDAGWDPTTELWHFRPSWNWDSPYPPEGTMYIENWGNPPTREIPSRRSFYLGTDNGVSLAGATAEGGRADCGWRDWCVHLTFHSSYGVLSDFDAFVLDRYDSAERVYGDGLWYAREDEQGPPLAFAPLVLGGFSPEERDVFGNISSWKVEEMARRFNETRTTTWTLYPNSDELDVILSFKQLYTLLPGYPDGNISDSEMNSDVIKEWGAGDQVLLRVIAKREGSGATSAMMPRVLNFTGSQLFQVDYYSSLEYPQNYDGTINAQANAVTLDVVFGRRRYGSGLPWNPARPSDACDACNKQVMNHPVVARCLHGHVPERIFQDIYEQSANEQMEWDGGEWDVGGVGSPSNFSYGLNDIVDACFGLRWLLNGKTDDGSWSSGSWFTDADDRQSSSGPGYGDTGYRWSGPESGSSGDRYNDRGRWSSGFREPVYRYDDSGSRWSSWGYRDVGSASTFGDTGPRWSSGGPDVGDGPSLRNLRDALAIARETDTGIQCFVESRCPVGNRNFAEAAGRMVVLEHEHAFVRVNFTEPTYKFYMWMGLEGLGSEGQFTTPELTSDHYPEEIAELIANAVPNASDYNMAIDVRVFNNLEVIQWANQFNDWIKNYYGSGGSKSEASAAWAAHSTASDDGSSFQFPPVGEGSANGYYPNVGHNSDSIDGTSPDSQGHWWFSDPFPVPDPQYTVEISLRNVSVVPNILDVFVVGDDPMESESSNMTWDARGSSLHFQLSPLNLTTFEYVPPPPYVNLTWNEEIPEYPDPYSNGSLGDWDGWSICNECTEPYDACNNNISCNIGVHAFLQLALSPSRFDPCEISDEQDSNGRRPWGVDLGTTFRQSAVFFPAEGYDLFMNVMACISKFTCDLDPSRQVYSYSKGEYISAEPTLLDIIAAESIFAVPKTTTGEPENILMKYRGKESLFTWSGEYMGDPYQLRQFIHDVMNEYNADESLWTRNPSDASWVDVQDTSDKYAGVSGFVFYVTFGSNYFVETEQPLFRAVSSDEYNELNSSNWKAIVAAYRDPDDEKFYDGSALVTWRKLSHWMDDLSWSSSFNDGNGNATAEDMPICHQCMNKWTKCISNQSCADTIRYNVLDSFWGDLHYTRPRLSVDISARVASWKASVDSNVYDQVLDFLSCLSAESCPVGYTLPSDPAAPLVPITLKLASHFAVTLPSSRSVVGYFNDIKYTFSPQGSTVNNLENWLGSTTDSVVNVQESINGSSVRYDISYYPAVTEIPVFYFEDDNTFVAPENFSTFGSFQLSSTQVQYGQGISADLLYYWFGRFEDTRRLFYYSSGDIINLPQICHGCPECWKTSTRCQNDMDCKISTRDVLVPLLRNATLPLSTNTEYDGRTQVKLDFSSTLLSLRNEAFQSREGWLAFAHLLDAMSSCGCEVGAGQWNSKMTYMEPTRVYIDSHAELNIRLYSTTQLDVWFNGNVYQYSTDGSSPPMDAAKKFLDWFGSVVKADPVSLTMENNVPIVDDASQSATFTIHLYEAYNETSGNPLLVNPNWIPTFKVTSADVSSTPPAEVIVTPWQTSLQSIDRYPVFDRLLDLLEYGVVSDEMPTSSSSGSFGGYTAGSH